MNEHQPIILAILDGWGLTPSWGGNAVTMGDPKTLNLMWRKYPHLVLNSFKKIAGSYRMVGNSVIGHSSIGAGKIVFQDLERISRQIQDKSFYQNPALLQAVKYANDYNSSLHIIGLVSDGGIHGHIDHLKALLLMAKNHRLEKVYVHAIMDGIDTDSYSGINFVNSLEKFIKENNLGQIATIVGRNYIMDRSENWDNIQVTIQALVARQGKAASSAVSAITSYYRSGIPDHSIPPTVISSEESMGGQIKENDAIVLTNYRSDRAKEITIGLLGYHNFRKLRLPRQLLFVAFSSYYLPPAIEKNIPIAFQQEFIENTLGKIISDNNLKQFRIAESEKQPHITNFFDCGTGEILPEEERVIIDSYPSADFINHPEMKAGQITNRLIKAIKSQEFNFILVNYANVDSLAHTGDINATSKAVEYVDAEINRLWEEVSKVDGTLIITADHGNAEQMVQLKEIGDRETFHTLNPVPLILVRNDLAQSGQTVAGQELLSKMIFSSHSLADIAPTILDLIGLDTPPTMEGKSLLKYLIRNENGQHLS